ncbi:DUF3225 domain-containing protein [Klebsiella pneumoniae subsp. pneumoniae]|nr:DUF3225 domain-containing protein [Klebsiella pneumoniae subsp. pneumoniae]
MFWHRPAHHHGWEPAKICMALRRSALSRRPPRRRSGSAICAIPPLPTFGADMAVCSTEFTRARQRRLGRQQQTWVRFPYGWRIVAAQVSLMD